MTIFEKIIAGEIPSKKVYEDDNFIAILDISPINPGHTLVIPKKVQENFLEEDQTTIKELFLLVQRLANDIKDKLNADGIKLISNNGASAGQEVFHTHIHIVPYYDDNKELSVDEIYEILKK